MTAQFSNDDYLKFLEKYSNRRYMNSNRSKTTYLDVNTKCELNMNKTPSPATKSIMTTATATTTAVTVTTAVSALQQSPIESMIHGHNDCNSNKIENTDYPCFTLPDVPSNNNDNMCNDATPVITNRLHIDCDESSDQSMTPMETLTNITTTAVTGKPTPTPTPAKPRNDVPFVTQTNHKLTTTDHRYNYCNSTMVQSLFVIPTFAGLTTQVK